MHFSIALIGCDGEQFTYLCGIEMTISQSQMSCVSWFIDRQCGESLPCILITKVYKAETRRNDDEMGIEEQTSAMGAAHWAVARDSGTPSPATQPLGTPH